MNFLEGGQKISGILFIPPSLVPRQCFTFSLQEMQKESILSDLSQLRLKLNSARSKPMKLRNLRTFSCYAVERRPGSPHGWWKHFKTDKSMAWPLLCSIRVCLLLPPNPLPWPWAVIERAERLGGIHFDSTALLNASRHPPLEGIPSWHSTPSPSLDGPPSWIL